MTSVKQNVTQFLDLRRTVEEYPLSRRKLQALIRDGRPPAFRLDGKIILRRQDIERLLPCWMSPAVCVGLPVCLQLSLSILIALASRGGGEVVGGRRTDDVGTFSQEEAEAKIGTFVKT